MPPQSTITCSSKNKAWMKHGGIKKHTTYGVHAQEETLSTGKQAIDTE